MYTDEHTTTTVRCGGCGGRVPDVAGPTHPYMAAAPGCWARYGEWTAQRLSSGPVPAAVRLHHVDCYAVQHPDGADRDRRQRQSVAVHLLSLCLLLEFGHPPEQAVRVRGRASSSVLPRLGLDEWPLLEAPDERGATTITDVAAAVDDDLTSVFTRWANDAWNSWGVHHEAVRRWAAVAVSGT